MDKVLSIGRQKGGVGKTTTVNLVIPRSVAPADAFAAGKPAVVRDAADLASQAHVNLATTLAERLTTSAE